MRRVGIPIILQIVKAADHDDAVRIFHKIADMQGAPINDTRKAEEL
jgi:hypothetical protein